MKLRNAILLNLGLLLIFIILTISTLNYSIVRHHLRINAEKSIVQINENLHRSTQSLLTQAITNYLRGITENELVIVKHYYNEFLEGRLTETEAKDAVQAHCNLQLVGKTGYLVAVKDSASRIKLDIHPFVRGIDCTDEDACIEWSTQKNGFIQYDWKNPKDNEIRQKVSYLTYFEPWNWTFGATSYRTEFIDLISIENVKDLIYPVKINETGYLFLFDSSKTVLLHPEIEGENEVQDYTLSGIDLIDTFMNNTSKLILYDWKNPSEDKYRSKYAYVTKLEDFGWYLGASGYMDEVYKPIDFMKIITLVIIVISIIIFAFVIRKVTLKISSPIEHISEGIAAFNVSNTPFIWKENSFNEIDFLGASFESMCETLNNQMHELTESIIELKNSKSEKEEVAQFLDSILNSMPSMLIGINADFSISQWNKESAHFFSISQKRAVHENIFDLVPFLQEYEKEITNTLFQQNAKNFETTQVVDNSTYSLDIIIYPLHKTENRGAVIRIDNITEKKNLEAKLNQARKMEAIGQLAGGIAHDYNNMLTGILTSVEEIEDQNSNSDLSFPISIIKNATLRTRDLTQNLLNFSRQSHQTQEPLHINEAIEASTEILKHSMSKTVMIETDYTEESDLVMGNSGQLQNVFINLGINAAHAMEQEGTLTFRSRLDLNKMNIIVEVTDTGEGIPESIKPRIFDPFFTTRKEGEGTGLGLASVYSVINQHNGTISFDSVLHEGTTFKIVLPLAQGDNSTESGVKNTPLSETDILSGSTILVIEDEPIIQMTVSRLLSRYGCKVLLASNGIEGIDMYNEHLGEVSVVLLDLRMPEMDGYKCFAELKKIDNDVKVIISSGYSEEGVSEDMYKNGIKGFIKKPYQKDELITTLISVITQ